MPDFVCNQDNGECMTDDGRYPTGAWKPKPKAQPVKQIGGYDADGQSQGNAKNIAGLWVAHGIIPKEQFAAYCDKIYSYEPKKVPAGRAKAPEQQKVPQSHGGQIMQEAMNQHEPEINVEDIPL